MIITLLQIVRKVWQWKNLKNRSVIGKDMDKSKVAHFLAHPVVSNTQTMLKCTHFMAVIDGEFCLDARVIYKCKTLQTLQWEN